MYRMATTHIFHASELPLIATNPAAWSLKREAGVFSDSEPAALGRAFARAMELACKVGRAKVDLEKVREEFQVPMEDLRELWDLVSYDPAGWTAEMPFHMRWPCPDDSGDTMEVHCRVDRVRLIGDDTVEVDDDKTERDVEKAASAEDHLQLLFNCVAAASFFNRPNVVGNILYVRRGDRGFDPVEIKGVDEINAVIEKVKAVCWRAIRESRKPAEKRECRVNDKCRYCGGRSICPIAGQDLKLALTSLNGGPLVVDEKTLPKIDGLIKLAESFVEQGKEAKKAFLRAYGKPVPDGLGREFVLREESRAKNINAEGIRAAAVKLKIDDAVVAELVAEVERTRGRSEFEQVRLINKKS